MISFLILFMMRILINALKGQERLSGQIQGPHWYISISGWTIAHIWNGFSSFWVNLFCVLLRKDLTLELQASTPSTRTTKPRPLPSRYYNQEKGSQQIPSPTTEQKSGHEAGLKTPLAGPFLKEIFCFLMPGCWVIYILTRTHACWFFPQPERACSQEKTCPVCLAASSENEALVILDFFTILSRNYEWLM